MFILAGFFDHDYDRLLGSVLEANDIELDWLNRLDKLIVRAVRPGPGNADDSQARDSTPESAP
ncbi:MAG: hypothetical protein JJU36_02345 [Phycisphaeraceae bacterium]|nr:hypothetical protein [Phycisphaeraceae bacterium]